MATIAIHTIEPAPDSRYIKPQRVIFEQNGKTKSWDFVQTHDSVAILLYHAAHDAFVLVKQFRPAVYFQNHCGFTYELCAGLVDKDKAIEVIASEEIEEETGYHVDAACLHRVTAFYTAVGFAGGKQTLFFAVVDEQCRLHPGGGVEGEEIEIVELPVAQAWEFILDETKAKTPGLMFAFLWFFENRAALL